MNYILEENDSKKVMEEFIEMAVIEKSQDENKEMDTDLPIIVEFEGIKKENKEILAWIYLENTNINYPIVQGNDNEYYLHRLLNGKYNTAGTIFMDYHNSPNFTDFNTIIYGHNMKNGTMFGELLKYRKQEYYEEHKIMYLFTEKQNYRVELFAGYTLSANSNLYNIADMKDFKEEILENAKEKSTFKSDVTVNENDRIITLSTCSYDYDEARYVVMGVLRDI